MKKHTLLLAAGLLAAGFAQAQDDRRGFIGVGLGASIPSGDFAATELDNEDAGFAKTGVLFDIQAGYRFTEVVGAMLMFRSQANQFDESAFEGIDIEVEQPYGTGSVLVGPFVSFPFTPDAKIAFEARALFGYATLRTPKLKVEGETVASETAGGFAYLIGPGIRFNLADRFGLGLHVDYFATKPEFEETEDFEAYKQPVQNINVGVSLNYRFL